MAGRLPDRRVPDRRSFSSPISAVILGVIFAAVPAIAVFLIGPVFRLLTPPEARVFAPPSPPISIVYALKVSLGWCLLLSVLLGGPTLFLWLALWLTLWLPVRLTEPDVLRANKRDREGDVDGAIRELREAIEAKGPSVRRLDALADCLLKQERWSEAYKVLLDLGGRKPLHHRLRGRKALALWEMGQPEAALAMFERPTGREPERLPDICTYCQVLIDLGLYDRAWDQLWRAERRFYQTAGKGPEAPNHRGSIDACRARLAEHFAVKKPCGLDEL